jgi:hypothetical protein
LTVNSFNKRAMTLTTFSQKPKRVCCWSMTNVRSAYLGHCTTCVLSLLEAKLAAGVLSGFKRVCCEQEPCRAYLWSDFEPGSLVESRWNVMAHGDAREGKRRGNWRMKWGDKTLHTTSELCVASITTAVAHTSAPSTRLKWRPHDLNELVCFAERRYLVSARVPSHFKRSITSVKATKETQCIWLQPRCTTFSKYSVCGRGRDSVVGIRSDSLRAAESGDRIPVRKRFSAHVQTGPGTNTASYTIGSGSFPGIKRPGRGVDHPIHLTPRLKEE